MRTEVLPADHPKAMARAHQALRDGGLVAFPTDTVYGVGALAFEERAVRRLYEAKGRTEEKAIPVLIARREDLHRVALDPPPMALRLSERFWPGPLTLVVARQRHLPEAISSTDMVGVRMPDHPVALRLLDLAGPLAVTSANRSGGPSRRLAADVFGDLGGRIEIVLDGGETPGGRPSTVVDCMGDRPVLLREGPLSLGVLLDALA